MAGEGGILGQYVIEARQFDIKLPGTNITIAQHNFLVLYGPDGSILGEQHYQPIDPKTGIAMDFSFGFGPKLGYNLYTQTNKGQIINSDGIIFTAGGTGSTGGVSGLWAPGQNAQPLWIGGTNILNIWNAGDAAGTLYMQRGPAFYDPLGGMPNNNAFGNSNNKTNTDAMGVQFPKMGAWTPGDAKNLLSPSDRSAVQYQLYPNSSSYQVPDSSTTIFNIADATGTQATALIAANPGVDFSNLQPGQQIILPSANNSQLNVQTNTTIGTPQDTGAADMSQIANNVNNGNLIVTPTHTASMDPADVGESSTGNAAATTASSIVSDGFRPGNFNLTQWFSDVVDTVVDAVVDFFDGASQILTSAFTNIANIFSSEVNYTDPLILDLNSDGVRLTNYTEKPVLFDVNHDGGSLEVTGWVTPQDGILVHDLNGNGVIDNIAETLSEYYNGTVGTGGNAGTKPFANGFAALKSLDSNSDNQFTSADTAWNTLRVWVDDNADGLSFKDVNGDGTYQPGTDTSELKTFDELGIASINLTPTTQSGLVNGGNEILATGSFVIGGQTREAQAANFIANPDGHTFLNQQNGTNTGTKVMTQAETGGTSSYVSHSAIGEVMNTATLGVNNLYGGAGNDTLTGDANDNWLAGGVGSDTFNAGDGDDARITRMNRRAMRRELGRDQWNHCYAILMNS